MVLMRWMRDDDDVKLMVLMRWMRDDDDVKLRWMRDDDVKLMVLMRWMRDDDDVKLMVLMRWMRDDDDDVKLMVLMRWMRDDDDDVKLMVLMRWMRDDDVKLMVLMRWMRDDDVKLMVLMRWMFVELGLDVSLHIDMDVLDSWICAIYRGYLPVPFHNYYHCFCVAQMAYAFIWMLQLKNNIEDLDILALMVAAIAHDMNHPGLNNTFQAISVSLHHAAEVADIIRIVLNSEVFASVKIRACLQFYIVYFAQSAAKTELKQYTKHRK